MFDYCDNFNGMNDDLTFHDEKTQFHAKGIDFFANIG